MGKKSLSRKRKCKHNPSKIRILSVIEDGLNALCRVKCRKCGHIFISRQRDLDYENEKNKAW